MEASSASPTFLAATDPPSPACSNSRCGVTFPLEAMYCPGCGWRVEKTEHGSVAPDGEELAVRESTTARTASGFFITIRSLEDDVTEMHIRHRSGVVLDVTLEVGDHINYPSDAEPEHQVTLLQTQDDGALVLIQRCEKQITFKTSAPDEAAPGVAMPGPANGIGGSFWFGLFLGLVFGMVGMLIIVRL